MNRWLRRIGIGVGVFVAVLVVGGVAGYAYLRNSEWWPAITLFSEEYRVENFRNMDEIFPSVWISAPAENFTFARDPRDLPETFTYQGETRALETFLERTVTTGFLVVHEDTIVSEAYFLGSDESSLHTSWSMAKSFVSALIGIALEEGHIASLDDPVDAYVPKLADSGYAGVPIRHVLQMSSGIDFNEDYEDVFADVNMMFYRPFATGTPISEFVAELESKRPSGEFNQYASSDTQVLGMVLEAATGVRVPEYLETELWQPLGMEADAHWSTDRTGETLTFCCLNATLRDYARFGRLYLNEGVWQGEQVLPEGWVHESVTPSEPHLQAGENPDSDWTFGYQYQWWIPEDADEEFVAIGVWGQYIYVDPGAELIIVKNSVDPDFDARDYETVAAFRAISEHLQASR